MNPLVEGSSPSGPTKFIKFLRYWLPSLLQINEFSLGKCYKCYRLVVPSVMDAQEKNHVSEFLLDAYRGTGCRTNRNITPLTEVSPPVALRFKVIAINGEAIC